MDTEDNTARDLFIAQILLARTTLAVATTKRTLMEWRQMHPEDQGMRDGFEHLALRQEIAEDKEAERLVEQARPVVHAV